MDDGGCLTLQLTKDYAKVCLLVRSFVRSVVNERTGKGHIGKPCLAQWLAFSRPDSMRIGSKKGPWTVSRRRFEESICNDCHSTSNYKNRS